MGDRDHITSLERGLTILETVGASFKPLTLTEVSVRIKLSKTTTQRFLNTLCAVGYLKRDDSKRYALTRKILSLGFNFLTISNLTKIARHHIDELSSLLQRTVNLAVLDGFEIVYLYRQEVTRFLKYDLGPGSRLPAYCSSAGKILLAGLDDKELISLIEQNQLLPVTPKTITSKPLLLKEIQQTRKRGYSICDRELSMDLYSMAAPLFNDQGKLVAAVNVTMGSGSDRSSGKSKVVNMLTQTGEELSRLLGYQLPYPQFHSPLP